MKRILLIIFFLAVIFSCNNKQNKTSTKEKTRVQESKCDKCDKEIVRKVAEMQAEVVSFSDLEKFLCAFDRGCKWSKKYPSPDHEIVMVGGDSVLVQHGESTYSEIARDILVAGFCYHFSDYMKILEANEDIDKRYLLSLMEYEEPMDLPFAQILDSLQHYQSDHPIKDSLIGVFEENVQRFGY